MDNSEEFTWSDVPSLILTIVLFYFGWKAYLYLTRKKRFFELKTTRHLQYWQPGLPSFRKSNSEDEVLEILLERYSFHHRVRNENLDDDDYEKKHDVDSIKSSEGFINYVNSFRKNEPWIFYFYSPETFKENYQLLKESVKAKRDEYATVRKEKELKKKTYY